MKRPRIPYKIKIDLNLYPDEKSVEEEISGQPGTGEDGDKAPVGADNENKAGEPGSSTVPGIPGEDPGTDKTKK